MQIVLCINSLWLLKEDLWRVSGHGCEFDWDLSGPPDLLSLVDHNVCLDSSYRCYKLMRA